MGIKLAKEAGNHLHPSLRALEKTHFQSGKLKVFTFWKRRFRLPLIADWCLAAAPEEPQG